MSDKSSGKEPAKKPVKGKSQAQKRQKVARNFIKSYGRGKFRELLSGLAQGKSGLDGRVHQPSRLIIFTI